MYYFVYKTTNLINGKFYIGIHSTNNINDGYLGSGYLLKMAIKKYGSENFSREIIKYFDSIEEARIYEAGIVTEEFVGKDSNYNLTVGGGMPPPKKGKDHHFFGKKLPDHSERMKNNNPGSLPHVIKKNKTLKLIKNDTTGECKKILKTEDPPTGWSNINSGMVTVRDFDGNCFSVSKNDPRYLSGELVFVSKGLKLSTSTFIDKSGNLFKLHRNDPKIKNEGLIKLHKNDPRSEDDNKSRVIRSDKGKSRPSTKDMCVFVDKDGNRFKLHKNDPRIKNEGLIKYSANGSHLTIGMKVWNNGIISVRSFECPGTGWFRGFAKRKKYNENLSPE